jgi:hypothetical protein
MTRDIEWHLSVYEGRHRVGRVIQHNGWCDAFRIARIYLGSFRKLKAAANEVTLSRSSSRVPDTSGRMDNSE